MKVTMAVAGVCIVAGLGLSLAGYAMGGEPGFWDRQEWDVYQPAGAEFKC